MTSKIYLKGVRAYGYVGYLPEENVLGQWFEVDATIWTDFEAATSSDAIADTLDYRSCITKIEKLIQTSKFALIERLAGAIADSLLEDPKIEQVQLRVTKRPPIPNFQGSVAVEIVRTQESGQLLGSGQRSAVSGQLEEEKAESQKLIADSSSSSLKVESQKLIADSSSIISLSQEDSQTPNHSAETFGDRSVEPRSRRSPKPHTAAPNSIITKIYTDGACSKNPGPGGWGVVVNYEDGEVTELGGNNPATTNNQMEMQAVIAALEFLSKHSQSEPVELFTDSRYVIDGINKWIKSWRKNGWQTKDMHPVKNQELWQTLDALNSKQVLWRWVQGHAGDPDNERCDAIARAYSHGKEPDLRSR